MAGGPSQQQRRLLYYFAPLSDLADIIERRRIAPTLSVRSGLLARLPLPRRFRLVWLSDAAELAADQARGVAPVRPGLVRPAAELVRFTLSVADAQYWPRWARRHGIGRRRRRYLDDATGGLSGRAWVVAGAVPASEWVHVDALRGDRLWPSDHPPAVLRTAPVRSRSGGPAPAPAGPDRRRRTAW